MQSFLPRLAGALTLCVMLVAANAQAKAQEKAAHSHSHSHETAAEKEIYKGYFEDEQIKERTLADWQGDWQSVYPYLKDGTLDAVMAHKAEHGDKTAEEYRAYYETGYATDVNRIVIAGDKVTFHNEEDSVTGVYSADGYEILTYKKGNRGVRFIFEKTGGDAAAPRFIQFSDHRIAPARADHYHLYWGQDRAALLEELTNWPTYFPAAMSGKDIAEAMIAH